MSQLAQDYDINESQKQDLIKLQKKTMMNPVGRVRRPRIRKRDPNHIPRPMNSFLSYRTEMQAVIRKHCPLANHREISKVVAKWWHEASDEEKQVFRNKAEIAKDEHTKMYPDYKFNPKKRKSTSSNKKPKRKTAVAEEESQDKQERQFQENNTERTASVSSFDISPADSTFKTPATFFEEDIKKLDHHPCMQQTNGYDGDIIGYAEGLTYNQTHMTQMHTYTQDERHIGNEYLYQDFVMFSNPSPAVQVTYPYCYDPIMPMVMPSCTACDVAPTSQTLFMPENVYTSLPTTSVISPYLLHPADYWHNSRFFY
ncbi:hypothetical protein G6F70_001775 [Rhizopus microsporus]|uniref:HMG box domain-containing protein n=2 Tax=Rhizopus TaxID=4842 RepID=A0A367J0G3_RHIAZ|nr:hypothetical protein G6F71_000769 [Rhizopus microsporus]RCH83438.1 hypothetical protein CU097_006086 [Rhizopus azygosporus]KAG1202974.1 hypothetical protein G6F70_001775 [Rhizopus microsporus]KAG1214876.1 hypothetical protein G6F69_001513 [Rhizopus microsporus]KAG1236902.1 hypothetical protein G6F67_001627 [Rhizopus microsporus]